MAARWVGDAVKVQALAKTVVKTRTHSENSEPTAVQIPDHLDILAELANGAQAHIVISDVTGAHCIAQHVESCHSGSLHHVFCGC